MASNFNGFLNKLLELKDSTNLSFCIKDCQYTYLHLFDYVEQIYELVQDNPESSIGLYASDDIRTYAAILALWYAGKAYVPLNPVQPLGRHQAIMDSVGCQTIISASSAYSLVNDKFVYIRTAEISHENYIQRNKIVIKDVSDDKLAYIIFTSGSTGNPKGVQISRGNIQAFIDSMSKIGFEINSNDRCLQPFDLSFDFSISSYVIPLYHGASVFTVPPKVSKFIYIATLLEKYHLTVLQMVPSMVRNLLPYLDELCLDSVRYNIFCGESLYGKVIEAWHQANPDMISFNMYGPTENTVFCTYYKIDKENISNLKLSNGIVSIGHSFINSNLSIENANGSFIDYDNEEGELCLCGEQLTSGYWKNEKENQDKFFNSNGKRYYRTGDLCYFSDGKIMYVGRKDFQVKINGFRVEIGEIESRYNNISGGRFAVVVPFVNQQSNMELAIVIEGLEYDYLEHKAELANLLPSYEVPTKWLFMQSIPLNQNGKIDLKNVRDFFNLY